MEKVDYNILIDRIRKEANDVKNCFTNFRIFFQILPSARLENVGDRFVPPVRVSEVLLEHHGSDDTIADCRGQLHGRSDSAIARHKHAGYVRAKISAVALDEIFVGQLHEAFQKSGIRLHTDEYEHAIASKIFFFIALDVFELD